MAENNQVMHPDGVSEYRGIEFARWGQSVALAGETLDPVPAVYSSADCVEMADLRMDIVTAEALSVRLQAAIAYERAKATGSSAAAANGAAYGPINECPKGIAPPHDTYAEPYPTSETFAAALVEALDGVELGAFDQTIVRWLAGWDTSTVATIVSLLHRARRAGSGA